MTKRKSARRPETAQQARERVQMACIKGQSKMLDELHGLGVTLAHALRLAMRTEFPKERRAALDRWEAYVLKRAGER